MITYQKLAEKFIDKGYIYELHYLILIPPSFIKGKAIANSIEEEKEIYNKIIKKVYGKDWEYWNTWIDYQKHK